MSMKIDFSDFDKGFAKAIKLVPDEAGRGLFDAGNALLKDAIEMKPYVPYGETGNLRGSARVNKAEIKKGEVSVEAGFNIEYAARWHELTPEEDGKINWSLPGSGRKYLESKMTRFKDKYMKIAAKSIELALRHR